MSHEYFPASNHNPDLLAIETTLNQQMPSSEGDSTPNPDLSLEAYFRRFVLEHQDRMTETELAKKLGISRKALWERRQRFSIPRNKKKPADQN